MGMGRGVTTVQALAGAEGEDEGQSEALNMLCSEVSVHCIENGPHCALKLGMA